MREINAEMRNAYGIGGDVSVFQTETSPNRALAFYAGLRFVILGSLVFYFVDFALTWGWDRWALLSFLIGVGFNLFGAAFCIFIMWFGTRVSPPIPTLTGARRLFWTAVLLLLGLVFMGYVYGGMYYCISSLRGWSDNGMANPYDVSHYDIFSDHQYAAAYMFGFLLTLPAYYGALVVGDKKWDVFKPKRFSQSDSKGINHTCDNS